MDIIEQMKLQKAEFDALDNLVKSRDTLYRVAVVDDDYPEVRHNFEGALASYICAMKANKRFETGNRYRLAEV